jgi:multidrug resistance efflux pump
MRSRPRGFLLLLTAALCARPHGRAVAAGPPSALPLRLHGTVEPVQSFPITAPRLTGQPGQGPSSLVIVHLVPGGTRVTRGDLLIEFDRAAQTKTAHDKQADYLDFVAQLQKKRAEQATERAHDDMDLADARAALRGAELDVQGNEMDTAITAEKNNEALEEARAKLKQLEKTYELKRRSAAADLRLLEIERDRAANAWHHAEDNAGRMRMLAPMDGLVVLKTTWKNGTMGEVQEGEEVRPGLPILDVVDPTAMRIRARVSQADIDRIRIGQAARITLTSYPSVAFTGRVRQLSPIGSTTMLSNRVRTFAALITVDRADPHLLPDLAAAVDIQP